MATRFGSFVSQFGIDRHMVAAGHKMGLDGRVVYTMWRQSRLFSQVSNFVRLECKLVAPPDHAA